VRALDPRGLQPACSPVNAPAWRCDHGWGAVAAVGSCGLTSVREGPLRGASSPDVSQDAGRSVSGTGRSSTSTRLSGASSLSEPSGRSPHVRADAVRVDSGARRSFAWRKPHIATGSSRASLPRHERCVGPEAPRPFRAPRAELVRCVCSRLREVPTEACRNQRARCRGWRRQTSAPSCSQGCSNSQSLLRVDGVLPGT
jgi:hypothetical protein